MTVRGKRPFASSENLIIRKARDDLCIPLVTAAGHRGTSDGRRRRPTQPM